ncbi:hypothetical protein O181_040030 [Austropuccinia psidii MF-1]|uniref:Uncharacterized protein n=1 Tax=Austropuccinia psidii MF-1 TaxID=1389203 RepID=A0A9Q3DFY6_9BASI|nr:hypothetical protein [Austropuccinia psidii MF-1]
MSQTYAPAPSTAQAPAPTARGSTCVTQKCSMPFDIRPSHALPLCAGVTPMGTLNCAAAPTMSPAHAELIHGYKKLAQYIIFPWCAHLTHTCTHGTVRRVPPVSRAKCQSH